MMAASQRHDQTCGKPSGQPSEDVDKQVGENIARAMRAAGMVQAQLGAKIGMSQTGVSKLIHGQKQAKASTLRRVAEACGVSVETLVTGQPGGAPPAASTAPIPHGRRLTLEQFMEAHGDDLTGRERRVLEKLRHRENHEPRDWFELIRAIREEYPPPGGGASGGGTTSSE